MNASEARSIVNSVRAREKVKKIFPLIREAAS
jgi:hypothetical protein